MLRWGLRVLVVLGAIVLGSACGFGSQAKGAVTAQGTPVGAFSGDVAKCGSGLAQGFMGVDLLSADEKFQMRIIQNPDPSVGPTVLVIPTWEKVNGQTAAIKLTKETCSKLAIDVHPTGMSINDVTVLEGTASFECAPKSGGSVRGDLTFAMCH